MDIMCFSVEGWLWNWWRTSGVHYAGDGWVDRGGPWPSMSWKTGFSIRTAETV